MTLAPDAFQFVATLVKDRSAIDLGVGKEYLVESRLAPLARSAGMADVTAYIRSLRTASHLHSDVVEAMTTNETSWFRDRAPFQALRTTVLPSYEAQRRTGIRVWSAACSSGQEPYSLAMLVADEFARLQVSITATDLSGRMLDQARAGRYSQLEVNRGLPAPSLVKHFRRTGAAFEISASLRAAVSFRHHNLLDPPPMGGPFDVILMRNVLIYFDVPTKRAVLARVRSALAPGGWLILGAAESTIGIDTAWSRVEVEGTSIYQVHEGETS
ncbi:CheR family methyltransferase [Demequina sp.]|uniref:CheR family methyltransferase n=1 Tax=Demequina sp. TaxID=2050685 RepID=UPI003A8BE1A0